jgi:signal transduction histidine kinase/predicted metal-dependent HD superfamily phosphohydrolase
MSDNTKTPSNSSKDSVLNEFHEKREIIVCESIDSLPLISEVLELLTKQLPRNLYYHAKSHTDDVLREVVLFALVDGVSVDKMRLLAIAAAFHDAGFIESPVDNERIGARMARSAMEKSGSFTSDEIELVTRMIMDTRLVESKGGLRQVPTTDLSRYLLDADLSNFGREDFFEKAELQRKELGYDRALFLRKTFELINNHRWLTNAALKLRQEQKEENIIKLRTALQRGADSELGLSSLELSIERLVFLAKLPLLLNSSLKTQKIVEMSLEHLRTRIGAQAATVFLLEDGGKELTFWALKGGDSNRLVGLKMPSDKGIVGWVIQNQESLLVKDAATDSRFFSAIDHENKDFVTKNLICVPLTVRGNVLVGAIQVLNKSEGGEFGEDDLVFVEQFAHQVAMAIDNSKLYEALRDRNKKLEILDRRRNEMIQVIAHEFRTPLNVIQTSAELISSGYLKDEESVKEISATLTRGVDKLTKLISQVRNLSAVSSQSFEIERDKISVVEMLENVSARYREAASHRKIDFHIKVPHGIGAVYGDYSLIVIVLTNLVSNALRFTPNGGQVIVTAEKNSGLVKFSVIDTGIGIEDSQLSLIFEKFYEVADSFEHSSGDVEFMSGGLGLGLSTVKSILKAHGANISVVSSVGKGSAFTFSLPIVEGE